MLPGLTNCAIFSSMNHHAKSTISEKKGIGFSFKKLKQQPLKTIDLNFKELFF